MVVKVIVIGDDLTELAIGVVAVCT
jgi:hypothetical protein